MSGHSKWHNIKLKKGKVDAQRGALFTKLSKEIILAAKGGSPDPEANYRLKMAVEKAREFNMPQDNIKRAIARGSGTTGEREIEELRYEGYGPHGVAVVVDAATDNRNRTAGELRFHVSEARRSARRDRERRLDVRCRRHDRSRPAGLSEDAFTESALVDGVTTSSTTRTGCTIYTAPAMLASARDALRATGMKITDVYLGVRAKNKLELAGRELAAALAFLDALEEHEDVQRVFSNLDVSDVALEALV